MNLILAWFNDSYYYTLLFDISVTDIGLHSRSQECEKAKTTVAIISQIFQSIWCGIEVCWSDEPHTHFIPSI